MNFHAASLEIQISELLSRLIHSGESIPGGTIRLTIFSPNAILLNSEKMILLRPLSAEKVPLEAVVVLVSDPPEAGDALDQDPRLRPPPRTSPTKPSSSNCDHRPTRPPGSLASSRVSAPRVRYLGHLRRGTSQISSRRSPSPPKSKKSRGAAAELFRKISVNKVVRCCFFFISIGRSDFLCPPTTLYRLLHIGRNRKLIRAPRTSASRTSRTSIENAILVAFSIYLLMDQLILMSQRYMGNIFMFDRERAQNPADQTFDKIRKPKL